MVAQVADVTKILASVMEMVNRGNWVIFHKHRAYIQTMTPAEETTMKTLMNTLKRSRAAIERQGNLFVVEIMVQNE